MAITTVTTPVLTATYDVTAAPRTNRSFRSIQEPGRLDSHLMRLAINPTLGAGGITFLSRSRIPRGTASSLTTSLEEVP